MKTDVELLDRVAKAVAAMTGLSCEHVSWARHPEASHAADGELHLRLAGHAIRRPFELVRSPGPSGLSLLTLRRKTTGKPVLLVTTHVNPRQAATLRAAGVEFLDAAGNAYLSEGGLHVQVEGRRPPAPVADRPRAFHTGGLKLLFALLTDSRLDDPRPEASLVSRPYREIAAATGLPHSTVGWVMADLIRMGLVVELGPGARALAERRRLLERWTQGYLEFLRPKLRVARYRPSRADWWKDATLEGGLWSGEVAESRLTGTLKPGTAVVFGDSPSHAFVLRHGLQADSSGPVEFLSPFWRGEAQPPPVHGCVHPLLVYADLLAVDDDRTREAAQVLYARHLRAIVETA